MEYRSAQMASRGIASLALAYFAYDDLPSTMEELQISYFEEAVQFLLKHEKVNFKCLLKLEDSILYCTYVLEAKIFFIRQFFFYFRYLLQ